MQRIGLILLLVVVVAGAVVVAQGPLTPAAPVTSTVYNGTTPLVPRYCVIDEATNGNNMVVEEVTGFKIRVLALHLTMTGTAVTIRFESTGSGVALTGQMQPTQGNSITLPFNPVGWFETTTSQRLSMALSGAQSVDGMCTYVLVP